MNDIFFHIEEYEMSFLRCSMIWAVSIFLITISMIQIDSGSCDELMGTGFHGHVYDVETGLPIEGAEVYIINMTQDKIFMDVTDENGYYELQVGGGGEYRLTAFSEIHDYVDINRSIEYFHWERQDFNLMKYQYNLYGQVHFGLDNWGEGVEVSIISLENNETVEVVEAGEMGAFNLTLDPGNYSVVVNFEHFLPFQKNITISDGRIERIRISPDLEQASEDSEHILVNDSINIPSNGWTAYEFESEYETRIWLEFSFDKTVEVTQMDHMMYDYYKAKMLGENLSNIEEPYLKYDFKLVSPGGGMDGVIQQSPYYVVFYNDLDVDVTGSFIIKYDYGNLTSVGYEKVILDQEIEDEKENDLDDPHDDDNLGLYVLGVVLVIFLFLGIWIFIVKRKK